MWVIVPVKAFKDAKLRLREVLSPEQRARFSYLMLSDILQTLHSSDDVKGITLVSSDESVKTLADRYQTEFLPTALDQGYSHDAMRAIASLSQRGINSAAIIPADVPQLSHTDLSCLKRGHDRGIILCPAVMDGGTNGLLFDLPLSMPLMFGKDSLHKFTRAALDNNIPVRTERIAGLERDIDRPEDLLWFRGQSTGGNAWSYIHALEIACN